MMTQEDNNNNIISRARFISAKKHQQRQMWYEGKLADREFVDWLLTHGDDDDVEWLSQALDPDFDTPKDPANDN